ncbi:hypothetical protein [Spirosoma sp.]|uniref:hypothetical protein n=1 Tax=Spirosoma sp. TaxID=1899569 RepID=UPI00260A77FA|nr:hypothetical protein [Spirosoma sp.]MCX6214659.1 hypothetical protein [Spirosoma sp.]
MSVEAEESKSSILDISEWIISEHFNTRGSREKFILEDYYGFRYYFKKSKEEAGYLHEFWSEVIAYQIGLMLKFPVLKYEAAIFNEHIGCLCRSLIGQHEDLIEGLQFLQAYDPSFQVFNKSGRNRYSYQLIEKTFVSLGLSVKMHHVLETIIFDAIIGNQDRHQENWAFRVLVNRKSTIVKAFTDVLAVAQKGYAMTISGISEYKAYMDVTYNALLEYTLIYDNGSSLGRELRQDRIMRMLKDENMLLAYIKKGKAEIRWHDQHISHFELVEVLFRESGYAWYDDLIKRVKANYDENLLYDVLESVDNDIPDSFKEYKLSPERKELILKMTTFRVNYLANLL